MRKNFFHNPLGIMTAQTLLSYRRWRISNCAFQLAIGVVFAITAGVQAATYYVATNGNDLGQGTETQPFLTVKKGLSVAQPGDKVQLKPGIYPELVRTARAGTPGKPIIVDGGNAAQIKQFIFGHPHCVLQNTTVKGLTQTYAGMIYFDHNAHFCVASNNIVDVDSNLSIYGISWRPPASVPFGNGEAASDSLVVSNTVRGVVGITLVSLLGDRNVVKGNRLLDSGNSDTFRLFGRSNIISGNVCSNNYVAEGVGNHPDFIQTFGDNGLGSWGHIIEKNLVIDYPGAQLTQLSGDMVPDIGNWLFRNNTFVRIAMQASCTVPQIRYYNNVFYKCNYKNSGHALYFGKREHGVGKSPKPGYGGRVGINYAHGADVKNNAFIECGDARNTVGWYFMDQELTGVSADYNYVCKAGYAPVDQDALKRVVGSPDGWTTWGDWWEPNGVNGGDPKFTNLNDLDFRLLNTSKLIDRGLTTKLVPDDAFGIPRPSGVRSDIGFMEFNSFVGVPPTQVKGFRFSR